MKYFSVKAYDGTIVRVEESKLEQFTIQQEKIKRMLNEGKKIEEIIKILENNHK